MIFLRSTLVSSIVIVMIASACGGKDSEEDKDKADGNEQSLLDLYTSDEAKACHAQGNLVDAKLGSDGFELVCTDKKIIEATCTPETLIPLVIDADATKIQESADSGSQLLQCEDLGAGFRADWYKDNSVGGASRYRWKAASLLSGTWKNLECVSKSSVTITFTERRFTRAFNRYDTDDCSGTPTDTYTSEGTVTAAMTSETIGTEQQYLFDLALDKLTIKVTDTARVNADEYGTGCIDNLAADTDLVLTAADCLKVEYIKSIYVSETLGGGSVFGFAFPSRNRAWESTEQERVRAGFSTEDFEMYREDFLQ